MSLTREEDDRGQAKHQKLKDRLEVKNLRAQKARFQSSVPAKSVQIEAHSSMVHEFDHEPEAEADNRNQVTLV